MMVLQSHFANAIKEQLLGGYVLESVTCNYKDFTDQSIVGLVFMHRKTHKEKTLYFYDTDKVNYHISNTSSICYIDTDKQ